MPGLLKYDAMKRIANQSDEMRRGLIADILENLEDSAGQMWERAAPRSGCLRPDKDFSIREMFCALIPNGDELYRAISWKKSGGFRMRDVQEAAGDLVNTGDFANITGQFIWNKVLEGYNYPMALWPQLVETYQTTFLNGERLPGVGGFGLNIEVVGEGDRFPTLGLNEEFVDTPPLQKRGFTVEITKEMVIQDQTGLVLTRAGEGGKWLTINKDIRCIQAATGVTNTYSRNNISSNTYQASGSYINQCAVPLVNFQSVQTAELVLANIIDPNTGAPVVLEAVQIMIPLALKRTCNFLMQAGSVAMVDNQPASNTVRSFGGNPMDMGFWGQKRADVLCNSFVGNTYVIGGSTNNTTAWYLGDFRRALMYKEAWAVETTQMAPNNVEEFHRDVVQGWKVAEMGVPAIKNPRYLVQGNK